MSEHISQQYDEELNDLKNRVMAMGGLVENHIENATIAIIEGQEELASRIVDADFKVNSLEVSIDEQANQIIAKRQPTASDLRFVMMIVKTITDLERIGDEAEKIARMAQGLAELGEGAILNFIEIRHLADHVRKMLHDSLDAFARTNVEAAINAAAQDERVDTEYESVVRQLITKMMEDPRCIKRGIHVLWAVRALERIGDHAKNICEYVIYMVKGKDVRHVTIEQVKEDLLGQ